MKTQRSRAHIGSCVIFSGLFSVLFLSGCGRGYGSAHDVASSAVQNLGCKTAQSEMWNSLHKIVEQNDSFPSSQELSSALLQEGAAKGFKDDAFKNYVATFVHRYEVTVSGIQTSFAPKDLASWKKALAEMEVGIRVTSVHAALQDQITTAMKSVDQAASALDATCSADPGRVPAGELDPVVTPASPTQDKNFATVWEQLSASQNPEVVGVQKTLATMYQSCDVLSLPAMTTGTPNVSGIHDLGEGSRVGGGHIRKIDNLANVISSHYYISGQNLADNSCFDVRKDPPIYNFGAKPYTTSSQPKLLDLFKHVSTGGPTLGIDCSGYIFTALATAGLKMDPDPAKPLKADLVWGIPSGAFKEPQSNGLRCLQKIGFSSSVSVQPGDIVAINGHVVMIDAIGADPFGLKAAASLADCTMAKIKTQNFDFVISQSAPVKSGMGIDRMQIADYLGASGTIHDGLLAYALAACRAKFSATPNLNSPNLSIVRHLRTPACRDSAVALAHSDCVKNCRAL